MKSTLISDGYILQESVLVQSSVHATPYGAKIEIRLPWYRALPLSCVGIENLTIDGKPILSDAIHFELNDASWPLSALADLTDESWFVRDSAWLFIPGVRVAPGSDIAVTVTVTLYPPYIPGLAWKCPSQALLNVQQARL